MASANIFIGLGGTGTQTVTKLADVLHDNRERVKNAPVELFTFDTDDEEWTEWQARTSVPRTSDFYPSPHLVDPFDPDPFVEDSTTLPEFNEWFNPDWIDMEGDVAVEGVGGIRHKGRLVHFHERNRSQSIFSELKSVLRGLSVEDTDQEHQTEKVKVFLISSSFGGTGSSQLVDLAYWFKNQENVPIEVFSVLYLPTIIAGGEQWADTASCTLSELNFWQWEDRNLLDEETEESFNYSYGFSTDERFDLNSPPFETCFLVSGKNEETGQRKYGEASKYYDHTARSLFHLFCDERVGQIESRLKDTTDNINLITNDLSYPLNEKNDSVYPARFGSMSYGIIDYDRARVLEYISRRAIEEEVLSERTEGEKTILKEKTTAYRDALEALKSDLEFNTPQFKNINRCEKNNNAKQMVRLDLKNMEEKVAGLPDEGNEAIDAFEGQVKTIISNLEDSDEFSTGLVLDCVNQLKRIMRDEIKSLEAESDEAEDAFEEQRSKLFKTAGHFGSKGWWYFGQSLGERQRQKLQSMLEKAFDLRAKQTRSEALQTVLKGIHTWLEQKQDNLEEMEQRVAELNEHLRSQLHPEGVDFSGGHLDTKLEIFGNREQIDRWYSEVHDHHILKAKDQVRNLYHRSVEGLDTLSVEEFTELKRSLPDKLRQTCHEVFENGDFIPESIWEAIKKEANLEGETDIADYTLGTLQKFETECLTYLWDQRGNPPNASGETKKDREKSVLSFDEESFEEFKGDLGINDLKSEVNITNLQLQTDLDDSTTVLLTKYKTGRNLHHAGDVKHLYEQATFGHATKFTDRRFRDPEQENNLNIPGFGPPNKSISESEVSHYVFLLAEFFDDIPLEMDDSRGILKYAGDRIIDDHKGRSSNIDHFLNCDHYREIKEKVKKKWNEDASKSDRPKILEELHDNLKQRADDSTIDQFTEDKNLIRELKETGDHIDEKFSLAFG